MQSFSIDTPMEPSPNVHDDIVPSALNRQPAETNVAYSTNFRLMIPKVRSGVYFCTEVTFPSLTMEPVKVPMRRAPAIKFFGNSIDHGDLTVKFIVNDDYSNWTQMWDWFRTSLNYYGFFEGDPRTRFLNTVTDGGQLLMLNSKKNPVARVVFDGLMITSLGSIPFNSGVADNTIITCDATFAFTAFDIKEP